MIGSKGMVSLEDSSERKERLFYEKGIDWVNGEPIKRDGATNKIDYEPKMPLTEELLHFIDCIENGKTPLTNARAGMNVLTILELEQRDLTQAETKKVVSNPKKE